MFVLGILQKCLDEIGSIHGVLHLDHVEHGVLNVRNLLVSRQMARSQTQENTLKLVVKGIAGLKNHVRQAIFVQVRTNSTYMSEERL